MMAKEEGPSVILSVRLSEARAAAILGSSASPTRFAEFLLENVGIDEWLERFQSPVQEGEDSDTGSGDHWSREEFHDFLSSLVGKQKTFEQLCLLTAMAESGPEAPRSELRRVAGFDEYPRGAELWTQQVKAARRRLHTAATNIGRPPIFRPRAMRGNEPLYRIHPKLHEWLNDWLDGLPPDQRMPPSRWAGSKTMWTKFFEMGGQLEELDGPELVYDGQGNTVDFKDFREALQGETDDSSE